MEKDNNTHTLFAGFCVSKVLTACVHVFHAFRQRLFSPPLSCVNVCSFRENPIPNFPCGRVHEVFDSFQRRKQHLVKPKTNGLCILKVTNVFYLNHWEEIRPFLFQLCCQPLNRQCLNLGQFSLQVPFIALSL